MARDMTSEEGMMAVQRAIGQIEGRLSSVERVAAEHAVALTTARAEQNADLGRIYEKLDTIFAKMNQGMGMASLGRVVWAAVIAAAAAVAGHFWPTK